MSSVSYRTGLNQAVPSREARALFLILLVVAITGCASTAPSQVPPQVSPVSEYRYVQTNG